jgi:pimeloyl-ACP methyl ester carboxylesterase
MVPSAATLSKRYGELTMPVAIMAGVDDQIVEVEQAKRMHQSIVGSDLRLIDGAGHMVHHFVPQQVVEVIDAIRNISNGRTSPRLNAAE